jgi:putative ABC transport system permease protein
VVQQRTREIGIRLALGASRKAVAASVAWRSLVSAAAGAGFGLIGFWALRRILTSMLYETSTSDPALLTLAVFVLVLTAGVAAWLPTRRAIRIDPTISLRSE